MLDGAPLFFGMQHNLHNLINTHLFILCPNNSGSTFLKNVLSYSMHTWNLKHEGQNTFGYKGPALRQSNRQLIWASNPQWVERYIRSDKFDWPLTKKAWYAQAFSRAPEASVMVEKSPPFILLADQLHKAFNHCRFIIMVRNPYAMYEGIIRRKIPNPAGDSTDVRILAALHIAACLRYQQKNSVNLQKIAQTFTYEQLCEDPALCVERIAELVPLLTDLNFTRNISVKGLYNEPLRNMNDEQIRRLTDEDLFVANKVFRTNEQYLNYFGYELFDAP